MTGEQELVVALARRLVETPADQPLLLLDRKNDLAVALWELDYTYNGHACGSCQGIGTVRIAGRPGWERKPCPACGGTGLLRPGR